jgi:hypothetical protein
LSLPQNLTAKSTSFIQFVIAPSIDEVEVGKE